MVWVESEPLGVLCVGLCDELEGCEAFKCLEPFGEVIGVQEGFQVGTKIVMCLVVVSPYGGFL